MRVGGNALFKTRAVRNHAKLGLLDKAMQSDGWLSAMVRMLVPLDLALRCYQPSPDAYPTDYVFRLLVTKDVQWLLFPVSPQNLHTGKSISFFLKPFKVPLKMTLY